MGPTRSRRAGARLVSALIAGALAVVALGGLGAARAQAPDATFAYVVYPAGWNLISPGGQPDISVGSLVSAIGGPLYTFQPGDSRYETTTLDHVTPGLGYWAYFTQTTAIALDESPGDSASVTVAAGQCVMVGNPTTRGSARITGADRSYVFSAAANGYVEEHLVGIGRGAWACNDSHSGTVAVSYQGDVVVPSWPSCCAPQPANEHGLALLVFHNDSPQPVIVGLRQMTETGDYLDGGDVFRKVLPACSACPEYHLSQRRSCNTAAVAFSVDADPGLYLLHIQYEGANVPDLQVSINVDANTGYDLCYFVDADRPQ